ncbi:MAG: N-acetylneuraminate synthase family protein [Kiritimatiellae bacterium]|nr:N-acetylneuraminate synthase family protein [Kiritimatiellia bacterium]
MSDNEQKQMKIGGRLVGGDAPCYIIAEAGINHNGALEMALQLVDAAVKAGADAVKFQLRDLEKLYPEELLNNPNLAEWAFQYLLPQLQSSQLKLDDFRCIQQHCEDNGITFLCTPFDEESFRFLEELKTPAYKVASADLVNMPLVEKLAESNKPLILSTGMATAEEIDYTMRWLSKKTNAVAILHCVSTYPAPFENLNLRYIETLKKYGVPVGYSSHERGIAMPLVALTLGACIIEKHLTLDRTLVGPDHATSLEPSGFARLVRDIRNAEKSLVRHEKGMSTMEKLNQQVFRKSLIASCDCIKGTVVTSDMVEVKGPGKGLSPQRYNDLLGRTLERDICKGDVFVDADLDTPPVQKEKNKTFLFKHPWGLKARFHDLDTVLEHNPMLVELHFSTSDLNFDAGMLQNRYSQRLIVHAPEFDAGRLLDLSADELSQREHTIQIFQRTIDKAAELGKRFSGQPGIVFHLGGMSMDAPVEKRSELLAVAAENFMRLEGRDCQLLPENLPPRPWYLGGQWFQNLFAYAEDFSWLCEYAGCGMTLDLAHAQMHCNYRGELLENYVCKCLPYVRHVHISDAKGIDGEGLQIGEGEIDWDSVLCVLSEVQFSWVPEIWSGHLNNNAEACRALIKLNEYNEL